MSDKDQELAEITVYELSDENIARISGLCDVALKVKGMAVYNDIQEILKIFTAPLKINKKVS